MKGVLDHLSSPLDHRHEGVPRQDAVEGPTDDEFSFDVGSLRGRIDECAPRLFEQKMQVQVQRAKVAR